MKIKRQLNDAHDANKKSATIKTLSLQVAVSEPDLPKAVRAAFDLAKSGGRELNLAFNPPSNTVPANTGTVHLAIPRLDC